MVHWGTHTSRYDTCRTRLLETIAELEENKVLTGALRVTLVKIDSGDLDLREQVLALGSINWPEKSCTHGTLGAWQQSIGRCSL